VEVVETMDSDLQVENEETGVGQLFELTRE
jgi:hypothetical protein